MCRRQETQGLTTFRHLTSVSFISSAKRLDKQNPSLNKRKTQTFKATCCLNLDVPDGTFPKLFVTFEKQANDCHEEMLYLFGWLIRPLFNCQFNQVERA